MTTTPDGVDESAELELREETEAERVIEDPKSAPDDRLSAGPFDLSEVPAIRPYVDLGALKVLPREGLQLRLDVEEGSKRIVAVSLDYHGSTLQVQAFSSPKGSGVWLSILAQIETQLTSQGTVFTRSEGTFGPELLASVPGDAIAKMRFIGVDGPRWVLRGIVSGAALTDESKMQEIDELFRSLVVVRGEMPMPPRELLPLRVPAGAQA
jgi:hypothetical protein